MNHLKQAINLFAQRYRPWFDQQQIKKLEKRLNEITDFGERTEDNLTIEEQYEIYEIEEAIRKHKESIKNQGFGF